MATTLTTTELRAMSAQDLRRELQEHRQRAAKLRMDVEMKKEKDSAKCRRERRAVARIQTILDEKTRIAPGAGEKGKETLKKTAKPRTVRAPQTLPLAS
jgi:ribosomal protein L29